MTPAPKILLTKGQYCTVSPKDYPAVSAYKWCSDGTYALTTINSRSVRMHRFLLNPEPGQEVDHVDRNKLNNRRENLRLCTRSENLANRGKSRASPTSSKYKGVTLTYGKYWRAHITHERQYLNIGVFATEREAAEAYDRSARSLHGPFAVLNFPQCPT